MSDDTFARLIYLSLLFLAVGGYLLAELRRKPGRALQQMAVWGLIFLGVIGAAGLWQDLRHDLMPRQSAIGDNRIEAPLAADGHYYLTAGVNGVPVRFVVDTGASDIVLTRRDAERAGIATAGLAFIGQAQTANGLVATAPVRLDSLTLGPIHDQNLRAVVNGGQMDTSLLGMAYLTRFARVEFSRDRLVLER
ncbi:retropepsin-like aspartic protease family protein [Pontitalea aquivivens]|uniref:retropepsin-like aspartic protease family protein n=1 Tax=Pontitalea aquivivens TaxID=3388663 RepID=UPI0039705FB1